MKFSHPLILSLPLLIPMSIAALVMGMGSGPRVPRVMEDFSNSDPRVREEALEWFSELRRTTMWRDILPLLDDPDAKVREKAARVLEKMKNPEVLPFLDQAIQKAASRGHWDEVEDYIKAMSNMTYPHSLPYFRSYRHNESFPMKVRLMAGEREENTQRGLNAEVCFYSMGEPVYNRLGHVISSQAILFPEGQAMVEAAAARHAAKEQATP